LEQPRFTKPIVVFARGPAPADAFGEGWTSSSVEPCLSLWVALARRGMISGEDMRAVYGRVKNPVNETCAGPPRSPTVLP
jgi:hypothetical protein